MKKSILGALAFGFLLRAMAATDSHPELLGVWKLVSAEAEFQDTGERRATFGKNPNGYLILTTDGRMMAYLEATHRKVPTNDAERAAAFQSMIAYSGKYRFEGDKWITSVDAASNVSWVGTEQARFFTFDGRYLRIMTAWQPSGVYDNRIVRVSLAWEREK